MGSKKSSMSNAAVEMLLKAPLIRIAARFWSFVSSLTSFAISHAGNDRAAGQYQAETPQRACGTTTAW